MLDTDLLCSVADSIKHGRELMGSKWGSCEAEVIACQAIGSCALNFRKHGDAFSWQGTGTKIISGGGLGNNPKGMASLINDRSIKVEPYEGKLKSPEDTVRDKQGRPMVIRISNNLLHYAAGMINEN